MSTDQDWTNVWPSATTFKQSVVPLPITQGYVASDKENKGLPVEKYANAELMKIPNFFHLTPNHIKKHCAALKREQHVEIRIDVTMLLLLNLSTIEYCTPWPEQLNTDEACDYYLPIQVTTHDYLNSTPSIRDSRARVVKFHVIKHELLIV
jgi:small subunit ribosomal protein S35